MPRSMSDWEREAEDRPVLTAKKIWFWTIGIVVALVLAHRSELGALPALGPPAGGARSGYLIRTVSNEKRMLWSNIELSARGDVDRGVGFHDSGHV